MHAGYGMDVVLYRKYEGSSYVDPHDEEKVAFKDLPDRFPSVMSRDFRREQGAVRGLRQSFRDVSPLQPGQVQRAGERRDETARNREDQVTPWPIGEAAELATRSAHSDSENFRLRLPFLPSGIGIGEPTENLRPNHSTDDGNKKPGP